VNNDSDVIPSDPGGTGGSGSGGGGDSDVGDEPEAPPGAGVPNPGDPVAQAPAPEICGTLYAGAPLPGDELEVCSDVCEGQYNEWYLCDENPTVGATTILHPSCVKITEGEGAKLILGNGDAGKRVLVVGRCPDPSSPDGYGEPNISAPLDLTRMPAVGCPTSPVTGNDGSFTSQQNFATELAEGRNWKYYIWGCVPGQGSCAGGLEVNYTRYTNEIPWGITNVKIYRVHDGNGGILPGPAPVFPPLGGAWPSNSPSDCALPVVEATYTDIPGEYRIVLTDNSVSFALTSQYTSYTIYIDKQICGASTWTRGVRYANIATGATESQTWGGCRSPLNMGTGSVYGDLYRRRPGTTGTGLVDFDFVRQLLVP
jgi:hypothetical protein